MSVPSLHRESTDSLITVYVWLVRSLWFAFLSLLVTYLVCHAHVYIFMYRYVHVARSFSMLRLFVCLVWAQVFYFKHKTTSVSCLLLRGTFLNEFTHVVSHYSWGALTHTRVPINKEKDVGLAVPKEGHHCSIYVHVHVYAQYDRGCNSITPMHRVRVKLTHNIICNIPLVLSSIHACFIQCST